MKLPLMLLALSLAVPVVTASFPSTASAGMEEEASRQLGFARKELSEGEYARAIASAESALRLNPAAYEAFLLKALAYEQLGELELASSLLVAYREITKGMTQDPRADEALTRIREARSSGSRPPARKRAEGTKPPADAPKRDTKVDVEGYRERVKAAISAGSCAVAVATATELTLRVPADPEGWKLSGDAARCDGQVRSAALAYRRYQELGGSDARVELMLRGLLESLGTLDVVVERTDGGPVPRVRLQLGEGELLSPEEQHGGVLRFTHLPTDRSLFLSVTGRGLDPLDVEISALSPGELRSLPVSPHYVGLGTVRLVDHDPSLCSTTLITADGETSVKPGSSQRLTAGAITALVAGEHGAVAVPLEAPSGGLVTFDPTPWIPASLTIVDLPAGAEVRVFVDGIGAARIEQNTTVPPLGGRIDGGTGVRLAEPMLVDSLIGGAGGVFVAHPLLGEGAGSVVLEPGSVNATTFQWRDMEGVANVSGLYQAWSLERDMLVKRRGQVAAPIALVIGSGIASGVLAALAFDADRRLDESAQARDVALNQAALEQRTAFSVIAGIAGGVAVGGIAITGAVGAKARRDLAEFGEWDPLAAAGE